VVIASFLLLDPLRFLRPLPLHLLRGRRIGMVDRASWVGANLDDLSALTAIYDDGLSRLLARLLLPASLALAPFTFGFLISNSTY